MRSLDSIDWQRWVSLVARIINWSGVVALGFISAGADVVLLAAGSSIIGHSLYPDVCNSGIFWYQNVCRRGALRRIMV